MMLNMTETDYENWRDDLRCGGQEEYDTQYSAASLYEGGWRARDLPDLIEQFNLTGDPVDARNVAVQRLIDETGHGLDVYEVTDVCEIKG